jgi:hypothetical protein
MNFVDHLRGYEPVKPCAKCEQDASLIESAAVMLLDFERARMFSCKYDPISDVDNDAQWWMAVHLFDGPLANELQFATTDVFAMHIACYLSLPSDTEVYSKL